MNLPKPCIFKRPTGPCGQLSVARGLCRGHFIESYIEQWRREKLRAERERENAQSIINLAEDNIRKLMSELPTNGLPFSASPKPESVLRHTINGVTNSTLSFCHKCWKGFESGLECVNHEAECKNSKEKRESKRGSKPKVKTPHKPREATTVVIIDDEKDLLDI